MATFYIVGGSVKRTPHTGLVVTAYYKQDPENQLEQPQRLVVFNRWPPVKMEAEVIAVPLNGIYVTTSGHRIDTINPICPTTVAQALRILKRVDD